MPEHGTKLFDVYSRQMGLTAQQYAILCLIGQRWSIIKRQTPEEVVNWMTSPPFLWEGNKQLMRKEALEGALGDLLDRQWVQFFTEESLQEVRNILQDEGSVGPMGHWPEPGDFDFTWAGAAVWEGLNRLLSGTIDYWTPEDDFNEDRRMVSRIVIGTDHEDVKRELAADLDLPPAAPRSIVHGPTPIGSWRDEWWQLFAFGYVATLTFQDP